jgi:cellulose synthase/poly-beta-1,6-N-acetylglucosamine synthase-like glycosyltransferase
MSLIRWLLVGSPLWRPRTDAQPWRDRPQTRAGRYCDRHPRALRLTALIALGWFSVYLAWRIGWSWQGAALWLAIPLILAELYGFWSLATLTWFAWRIPVTVRPEIRSERAVDVYVCIYDEAAAVVSATLAGCAAIRYPHTTYLLDDGDRPEMAALAEEFGAGYLTREDNSNAKAGNINCALPRTDGELVFILDADHVPLPDALDALVGYFEDEQVGLVQSPHDFYNHDSVQHYEVGRHEQSVFYSVIQPGKTRHGAAFWCGSGAVVRREALLSIGGVATETIAEDFHTTIKLQRAGWKSCYHDEILVQGLAPHNLAGYLLQRDRWARGNLAVFTTPESPLRARELTRTQRFSYFASLTAYLAGPVRLLSLATLAAVLWSGHLPLIATPLTLGLLWGPTMLLSLLSGAALCRGYQTVANSTHFELCTAEINLRALPAAVRSGSKRFRVTPKHGIDLGGWEAIRQLRVVTLLTLVLALGLIARILEDFGIGFIPRLHGIALWIVPLLGACELRRLLRTLTTLGWRQQLRADYRVPLAASVALTTDADRPAVLGHARDITPAGMSISLPRPLEPGATAHVVLPLPTLAGGSVHLSLELEVVSCRAAGEEWLVGTRITGADTETQHRVLEYCHVVAPTTRLHGIQLDLPPAPDLQDEPAVSPQPIALSGAELLTAAGSSRPPRSLPAP